MSASYQLKATRRTETGKGPARRTRMQGMIPAVVYGSGREAESLAISALEFEKALQGGVTRTTVIDLAVDGATEVQALIREIQRHPARQAVTHVDFLEIHAGELLTLDVPLHLVGSAVGVRTGGGVLEQFLRSVEIEVLPRHIPERVDVDVTELAIGHSRHINDLSIPDARILSDPHATICTVVPPRVEEEVPTIEVEEEAEPELIRKPKAEEDTEATEETATEE